MTNARRNSSAPIAIWVAALTTLMVATPASSIASPPSSAGPSAARAARSERFGTNAEAQARLDTAAFVAALIRSLAVVPSDARPIGLRDAIRTAIRNNPGILADGRERELARQGILAAVAQFDPVFLSTLSYRDQDVLTSDALQTPDVGDGLPEAEPLVTDEYTWDLRFRKLLQYGTELEVDFLNDRNTSSAARQLQNPVFEPRLGLAVRQPLFRNFGGLDARTTVLVARNSSKQAVADFEAELSNFATSVVQAYWNRVFAEANLEVTRQALRLAEGLVEDARARVKIGTLAPVAIKEAQADAAAREEEVIAARNELDLASRTLQYTVMLGIETGAPLPIRPADTHTPRPSKLDRQTSMKTAVVRRAEVRSARLDLATAKLDVSRAERLLLPGLDFVMNWHFQGLGGVPESASETEAYGEALNRVASTEFHRFFVGIEIEVPFTNIGAKSSLSQAEITERRQREELRDAVSGIALEVEDATGDVASAYKRVAAARVARELAEENLRNQQKRYDVGMVTTTDILRFQDNVATAMASEARAIADHAIALADLQRAEGTLLDEYGINVRFEDAPETPWWTRF